MAKLLKHFNFVVCNLDSFLYNTPIEKEDGMSAEIGKEAPKKIGRRQFIREAALAALSLTGVGAFAVYFASRQEGQECAEWLGQIEKEKPGYKIIASDEGLREVVLLETGKSLDRTCFPGNPYTGQADLNFEAALVWERRIEDISNQTINKALTEIGNECEIADIVPIIKSGNTTGLIVRVDSCK